MNTAAAVQVGPETMALGVLMNKSMGLPHADAAAILKHGFLPLLDEKKRSFPLLKKIKTLRRAGETAEWRVWVRSGNQQIAGRLCGMRKE